MQPASVSVDGRILPANGTQLSAWDRGFQLGDGVFETLRARGGRGFELTEHVARLRHGLRTMEIPIAADLEDRLARDITRLLETEGLAGSDGDATVRITISRGASAARGMLPPPGLEPTMVIQAWPFEPPPAATLATGLALLISGVRRDPEHPLTRIKTTSRGDAVVARLEAQRHGADEALYLTTDGYLSEATSANLFLVRDGQFATPSTDCAILPGITRAWVLDWASRAGVPSGEGLLTTRDFAEADEAFLTSSVAGVVPVTRVDETTIGMGRPGPWTARARNAREACFEVAEE